MLTKRVGPVLILLSFVGACSFYNPHEIRRDYVLEGDSGRGVVIVSMAHPDGTDAYPPICRYRSRATQISGVTAQMAAATASGDKAIFFSKTHMNSSGRPLILGRISALELPPGDYEFWSCTSTSMMLINYFPKEEFSLQFTVKKGQISYVGRILVFPQMPDDQFGVRVADISTDDFSMVRDLWPHLPIQQIQTELLALVP